MNQWLLGVRALPARAPHRSNLAFERFTFAILSSLASLVCVSAPASAGQSGSVVGKLVVQAPTLQRFVLRGTLPVPPGTYRPGEAGSPFRIRGPQGGLYQTQIEVVSLYPNSTDGADVVELLTRVNRPPQATPGTPLSFDVVMMPSHAVSHRRNEAVEALIEEPRSVVLRTRDVFGHRYEADLLRDMRLSIDQDLRTLRDGRICRQERTHESLLPKPPVAGVLGTLPHMMGVHAYVSTWANEDFLSIDLRVHNGHNGLLEHDDRDDPMGKLYFSELELVVPDGWVLLSAIKTPALGGTFDENDNRVTPLVRAIGGGKLHMMPPQAQFNRRLILARENAARRALSMIREEGLAFCRRGQNAQGQPLYSWWNPQTARYWAQNLRLPDLAYLEAPSDSAAEMEQEYGDLFTVLTQGTPGQWPIVSGRLGWAHPYGLKTGGMVSGAEIFFFDGLKTAWGASQAGYRSYQLTHRMYAERHPTTLFNPNGDSYSLEDWIVQGVNGPFLPNWMFLVPWLPLGDPFGFTTAPTFQVDAVAAQGRQPDYENDLLDYQWIDTQHLIRYTRSAKVLAWLGNDGLAKEDLRLQAELCRATYTALPQTDSGWAITTGLLYDRRHVDDHPGDGIVIDRGEGWILDTVATAYALGDADFRARTLPWFRDFVDLLEDGQSTCSGTMMSKPVTSHFAGQYRILQSISETILQNGLWGVMTSAFEGRDASVVQQIEGVLDRSTRAMISDEVWDESTDSPHFYTALGPYQQDLAPFCGFVPAGGHEGNDGWQTWNVYVFGHLLTGDPRFLARATDMAGGTLTPPAMGQDNHPGELETRAGLISLLQTL